MMVTSDACVRVGEAKEPWLNFKWEEVKKSYKPTTCRMCFEREKRSVKTKVVLMQ